MKWLACVVLGLALAAPAVAEPGGWTVGKTGQTCTAAKPGPEVNTRLMLNNSGLMILIAARSDWNGADPITPRLSIDGAAPKTVLAQTVGPLVLVLVDQPELEAMLREAKTLQWTMPWGVFDAEVEGLGAAFDQLKAC